MKILKNKKNRKIIVFEEIGFFWVLLVLYHVYKKNQVYYFLISPIVEKMKIIKKGIDQNTIVKIKYADMDLYVQYNFFRTALEEVEKIFYEELGNSKVIQLMKNFIGSDAIEDAYKKSLAPTLYDLHRLNLFLEIKSQETGIGEKDIIFYPGVTYCDTKNINSLNLDFMKKYYANVSFLGKISIEIYHLIKKIMVLGILLVFPFWILTKIGIPSLNKRERIIFRYGIRVGSGDWSLNNKYRTFDFLLDGENINHENTVFCVEEKISEQYKEKISDKNYKTIDIRNDLRNINMNFFITIFLKKFFPVYLSSLVNSLSEHIFIIKLTPEILYRYLVWEAFSEQYSIKHYVSYNEYLPSDIIRNVVLEKQGIKTWCYAHSCNNLDLITPKKFKELLVTHYAYYYYDNFVVWGNKMANHYRDHPTNIKNFLILGCLWSEHIMDVKEKNLGNETLFNAREKFAKNGIISPQKVIGVFDTSAEDITPLHKEDMIIFINSVLRLLNECPDVVIIFKNKKSLKYILRVEPDLAPFYNKIRDHPRCFLTDELYADPSEVIAASDLIISAPFTSPTIEALGARIKAFYYDPTNRFSGCYYDYIPNFVAHNFRDLITFVNYWLYKISEEDHNIFIDTYVKEELDRYADGRAITRFRELLAK